MGLGGDKMGGGMGMGMGMGMGIGMGMGGMGAGKLQRGKSFNMGDQNDPNNMQGGGGGSRTPQQQSRKAGAWMTASERRRSVHSKGGKKSKKKVDANKHKHAYFRRGKRDSIVAFTKAAAMISKVSERSARALMKTRNILRATTKLILFSIYFAPSSLGADSGARRWRVGNQERREREQLDFEPNYNQNEGLRQRRSQAGCQAEGRSECERAKRASFEDDENTRY